MGDPAELIDRLLRGFNSAVHYMQNCGMDLERDFPEVEAGIAACVGLRAAISPAPTVPEGWRDIASAPRDRRTSDTPRQE